MRHVTWSVILPYVLAHVWPDPVQTVPASEGQPAVEPRPGFHICSGINGVSEMRDPDPQLVQAGFLGAFTTEEIRELAMDRIQAIAAEASYRALQEDDKRTLHLRGRLHEELGRNEEVKRLVCRSLGNIADDLALVVDDCTPGPSATGT